MATKTHSRSNGHSRSTDPADTLVHGPFWPKGKRFGQLTPEMQARALAYAAEHGGSPEAIVMTGVLDNVSPDAFVAQMRKDGASDETLRQYVEPNSPSIIGEPDLEDEDLCNEDILSQLLGEEEDVA